MMRAIPEVILKSPLVGSAVDGDHFAGADEMVFDPMAGSHAPHFSDLVVAICRTIG